MVRSALAELSDESYQRRVWTGRGGDAEMSSFAECVARLYDDSGLDLALERDRQIYDAGIDDDLRLLGELVARIDSSRSPGELVDDPQMGRVRLRAEAILRAVDDTDSR